MGLHYVVLKPQVLHIKLFKNKDKEKFGKCFLVMKSCGSAVVRRKTRKTFAIDVLFSLFEIQHFAH